MKETKYPMISRLGLKVFETPVSQDHFIDVVEANDLEKLLKSAPVVYQYKGAKGHGDWSHEIDEAFGGVKKYENTALLVGIQPIVKDTEKQSAIDQLGAKIDEAVALAKKLMEMVNK